MKISFPIGINIGIIPLKNPNKKDIFQEEFKPYAAAFKIVIKMLKTKQTIIILD